MTNAIRFLTAVGLLATVTASFGQNQTVMAIHFGDASAGECTYRWNSDGTFEGKTNLSIAGQVLTSSVSGTQKDFKIVKYRIENYQNGEGGSLKFEDGSYTIEQKGKPTQTGKREVTAATFMANLHPGLYRSVLSAVKPNVDGPQKVKTFFLDSGTELEVNITRMPGRKATFNGVPRALEVFVLKLGQLEVNIVADPGGEVVGMGVPTQNLTIITKGWAGVFADPLAKFPELSQPTFKTVVETKVVTPMRDGTKLVADIVRPDAPGRYPTILSRTPYGRSSGRIEGEFYARRGYAYVTQDTRGREDSEGVWQPFIHERKDGYDTIDWISKQPWSNAKVGMIGASYGGMVQWAAAVEKHPALKCLVPQVSPPDAFFNIPYDHGVPMMWPNIWWLTIVKDKKTNMASAMQPMKNPMAFTMLPLTEVDNKVTGGNLPIWDRWMQRETPNQFAGFDWLPLLTTVKIPALHISGWFDGDGIGTKLNWAQVRKGGNTNQWLIYGPWTHAFNTTSRLGDVDFGSQAILELESLYLRWFDTWLKGKSVKLSSVPKVQVFVTGRNKWQNLNDWPDQRSKSQTLYLAAKGPVNNMKSGGSLQLKPATSKPQGFTYDPAVEKVPAKFKDLSAASTPSLKLDNPKGNAYAYFETSPMKTALNLGGPIQLDLYFSTSAKDTDFFATLVDVHPNGDAYAFGQGGKVRARYLSGWNTPKLLTPGKSYHATIDFWDAAHSFLPGHRLGLLIASSGFPIYARNLGTGEPNATGTKMVKQVQLLYMDKSRPSALKFKILPN